LLGFQKNCQNDEKKRTTGIDDDMMTMETILTMIMENTTHTDMIITDMDTEDIIKKSG
jgi:hypothetical protein